MDFARKQLEKYGWTDGKGLGKNENGISEALKPKLKRSVTGVGHDPAAELNEHWWSALYNKAAENVEVKEKNGKTKKIKIKDDFNITTNTWQISKKSKNGDEKQYSDYFIRTEVLAKGGGKTEIVKECSNEEEISGNVVKMTDEELFAACEGRTAHKGARHGLRALGKLARIAQQEEMLLTLPKYKGYSHAKSQNDEEIMENLNLQPEVDEKRKKKKKKRKRCLSNEDRIVANECVPETEMSSSDEIKTIDNVAAVENNVEISRKKKKSKHDGIVIETDAPEKSKKKKKKSVETEVNIEEIENVVKKSKKR